MKIQLIAAFVVAMVGTVNAQTFTNYTTADGLLSDNVSAIDTDGSLVIYFGTQLGVSVFSGFPGLFPEQSFSENYLWCP